MDKSMVHQLSPLVASNVQYPRSSFIHTVYETDFNELRKSRIQNLPNYRKEDLSGKLNFVVVFQGIEIERLSVEVETLRVKIKDYERQLCNYQNYDVQIRQLTEKCHSYEMQRQDHQQAMEKMHKICQQLYNQLEEMRARYADIDLSLKEKYRLEKQRSEMLTSEIEKWKARYNASETSKAKELEDMRMMLQNQRKSMLQREMRELSVKHESQRLMLESELRKLRQNLQNRNSELMRTRQQLQQSRVRQGQLRQYESQLDEYEDKLMMMAQQNMRLNELLRMKKQQIQQLKNNQRNLQNRLQNLSKIQQQYALTTKRMQGQETELRQWNQKYSRLEAENNRNAILSNKAQEYERLLDNSAEEMEKMNAIIREKITDLDKLKTINHRLIIDLEESKATEEKINQYEGIIEEITNENQRLNDQLRHRLQQLQKWKGKYSQIEAKLPLLNQSQNQCNLLKEKLGIEASTRAKLAQTISTLQKELSKVAEMQKTLIKQRGTNKDLQRQIQRLNLSIRNLSVQNSDFTRKIQSLETQLKENSGLLEELQECKRTINMMTQQLDRINGLIHQKLQQIKQLKENYNSVTINTLRYRQIQEQFVTNLEQTQKLVLKLDESRRQNQCLSEKLINCEIRCKKLESEMFISNQEKEKLISVVNQKKVELEDLMSRMTKADQRITTLQAVQQQHKALKNNFSQLQQRYKDLDVRYNKETKRSEDLSNKVQTLTVQIMKLKNESNFSKQFVSQFINLKVISQQKDKMIVSLIRRIGIVEKCILVTKEENKKSYKSMCQQQQKWKTLSENFDLVSGFMDNFIDLQLKIDELSEQNLKLESSVNMINIELAQSQYASENSYKKIQDHRIMISSPKPSMIKSKESVGLSFEFEKTSPQKNYMQAVEPQRINSSMISSPSSKLATIEEDFSKESSTRTYEPVQPFTNENYCESQVRQLFGSGYPTASIYSSNVQPFNAFQNPQEVQYTTKALRPGSSRESTTTYSYTSSYGNIPNYSSSFRTTSNPSSESIVTSKLSPSHNYMNDKFGGSNVSNNTYTSFANTQQATSHLYNPFEKKERPASSFIKQTNKYSTSETRNSPDGKQQNKYQSSTPRNSVLSPVRFLG